MQERLNGQAAELAPNGKCGNFSFRLSALFLLFALLWNPGIFASPGRGIYLPLFTMGALGILAAGVLIAGRFLPLKRYFLGALMLFFLLIAGQSAFHFGRWDASRIGEALFWITVPAMVCMNADSFRKLLPAYVLAVGGYSFFYSSGSELRNIWSAGITGNVNWTASLAVVTMIFFGGLILEWRRKCPLPKRKKLILIFGMAGELLLLRQLWGIGSKGAAAAAVLTGLLYLFLRSGKKVRKILAGAALVCVFAGAVWAVRNTDAIGRFISDDGRVIFWENALRLIADHPLFGVGQGSFENEYMRYRNLDYFWLLNPAPRSNHPHNHLLFMAGSWGIAGLVLWGVLLFGPLGIMIRRFYRHEAVPVFETVCFLTVCCSFLHGCLDLVLVSMPTSLIALMCLGVLWEGVIDRTRPAKELPRYGKIAAALLMLGLGAGIAWQSFHAASQVRRALRNELTPEEIVQTAKRCPGEYPANYELLKHLEKRGDPRSALAVADIMLQSHTPNYPGLHLGRGNALMRLGRFAEALADYRTEAELFPLALRPVYNMVVAARCLKNYPLARKIEEELLGRMRLRGNSEQELKIIIAGKQGDHYDLRPREKPEPDHE